MRRRLMTAMMAMAFGALILSGLASLVIASRNAAQETRRELVREGQSLAYTVSTQTADSGKPPASALAALLRVLKPTLRIDGSTVVGVQAPGVLYNIPRNGTVTLPSGVPSSDLDPAALYRLQTVSGSHRGLAFAAVPFQTEVQLKGATRQVTLVVVLTRRAPSAWSSAGPWFALSSVLILLVAWLVAWELGRRFVRPIQAAQEVTGRVAAGDLEARVPVPDGAGEELVALAHSINQMSARLAQAKNAERLFLQSVSHDLRTPLTSIRGFAEAIQDGAAPDVGGAAAVIASEARRLERLVGDLLALATLEARRFTLQLQPVDLGTAVAATAAGFIPAAAELGLALVAPAAGEAIGALADPDRLAQVTANLVENALRYASRQVTVTVGSTATGAAAGGRARLEVQDDGPGIAPDALAHVFDRLYESRPRSDRPIGSGLGLAIVWELVAAMGGSVRAESPVGPSGGTRMIVELPAAQMNPSVGNRPPSTETESTPTTRSSTVA